jgi:hypothetical protein
MSKLVDVLRFFVRAIGLFFVGGVSAVLLFFSVTGDKPAGMMPYGCGLAIAAVVLSWPRLPDAWRTDPPTAKQLDYAKHLGIAVPPGASKGQVSDAISAALGK